MRIETERLVLRDYRPEDLDAYYRLKSDHEVWEYTTFTPITQKGEAAKLLGDTISGQLSGDTGYRALCLKDGTLIGEAGILRIIKEANRCEIGYNLLPAYWWKGYGTEIVQALVHLAFEVLKVERVEALTLTENKASCRMLEKAGFQREGTLRHYIRSGSVYRDVCYYGVIREDYKGL